MTKEEYQQLKKEEATRELLQGKLAATDNLWSPQADLEIFELKSGKKPRKMSLKPKGTKAQDNYVINLQETKGNMVFYINRDDKGNPIGEPKKYLQLISDKGIFKNEYVDGDKVEPYFIDIIKKEGKGYGQSELARARKRYNVKEGVQPSLDTMIASNFTALDDINTMMNKYGANGLDMSNADGLDESILQKYSNLTDQNLLDGLTENTSLLNADGEDFSNLTDQSLLDGLTENTSLLEFEGDYSNMTNQSLLDGMTENTSLLNADGEDYSNGIGDWFKKKFSKKKKALEVISEPQTDIVDAKTMQEAYKESGSKKSLKEWISSDKGKNFVSAVTQFGVAFLNKAAGTDDKKPSDDKGKDTKTEDKLPQEEYKILGMTPVVFGIVAVGAIVITAVVATKVIKK